MICIFFLNIILTACFCNKYILFAPGEFSPYYYTKSEQKWTQNTVRHTVEASDVLGILEPPDLACTGSRFIFNI